MNATTRSLIPSVACQKHLDTAYAHVKALLVAHGDESLTNFLMSGGDAVVDAWLQQAWRQARAKQTKACHTSLQGWYRMVKARVDAAATADPLEKGA